MQIQGIFLKRQHEQIIGALIKRLFMLLDTDQKSIAAYKISPGMESAVIQVDKNLTVRISIESLGQPLTAPEPEPDDAPISPV